MTIKTRKNNLDQTNRYKALDLYIYSSLSNKEISEKLGVGEKSVERYIRTLYKDFLNARETKCLLMEQALPINYKSEILDTNQINEEFLNLLSEPDSGLLSDNELLFCEMLNQDHDEIKALEVSKLNKGLKSNKEGRDQYKVSCQLRSFYLRRKPNVASYLTSLQQQKLEIVKDGKGFIQAELMAVIEKLKRMDGERSTANYLKAVDTLARLMGLFTEKIEVTNVSGDAALDRILNRAKEAGEVEDVLPKPMLAYADGVEIYE